MIRIVVTSLLLFFVCPEFIFPQNKFQTFIHDVQEKAKASYEVIDSVAFEGHSKSSVYFGFKPFDLQMVPMLEEYYFEGFWQKPDSLRMNIRALRKVTPDDADSTMEIMRDWLPLPNPFMFIYDPSSIGMNNATKSDDTTKYWPVYPFAQGADSIYDYIKSGQIAFEDNQVWVVDVKTKKAKTPGVTGSYHIDPTQKTIVGSDVVFNEAASLFNPDVKAEKKKRQISLSASISGGDYHRIKTEKALFYGTYWLPTRMEEEFRLKLWGMKIRVKRELTFDVYLINPGAGEKPVLADSGKQILYARDPEFEAKVFPKTGMKHRLSVAEQEAIIRSMEDKISSMDLYKELLSDDLIADVAANMTLGKVVGSQVKMMQNIGQFINYNRVEGLRLSYGLRGTQLLIPNSAVSVSAAYGAKDRRWKAEGAFILFPGKQKRMYLQTSLYRKLGYMESPKTVSTIKNSWSSLLFKEDYRDYFYKTGFRLGLGLKATDNMALKLDFVSQDEETATSNAQLSLIRYNLRFRPNPEILEGKTNSLEGGILYRSHDLDLDVSGQWADSELLGGDQTFKRLSASLRRTWRTSYHSHLHLHARGGTSAGSLPPQRCFDLGGKVFMDYHGHLRGVSYKRFTGDRSASAILEYSLNGSAFHDLGWKWAGVHVFRLSFWAGGGWSHLSENSLRIIENITAPAETAEGGYSEFGIGLSDRFNILRLDLIRSGFSGNGIQVSLNFMH